MSKTEIEITPELLANLKDKAKKATQGQWFITCDNLLKTVINCVALDRYETRIANFEDDVYAERNAAFIADANPSVILALIEHIERLEKDFEYVTYGAGEADARATRLEREANWLAEQAGQLCSSVEECAFCWRLPICNCIGKKRYKEEWRKDAKEAIDKEDEQMEAENEQWQR